MLPLKDARWPILVRGMRAKCGGEMADIALRRWRTFDRRNKKKRSSRADRMEDLAKGLRDAGDMDRHLVGPLMEDYRYLAGELASVLETVKA